MIFCYSASQNSKAYATVLSRVTNLPIYMLEIENNDPTRLSFPARAIWSFITKNPIPITNMPGADSFNSEEIYICGPIWGGKPSTPLQFFLQNAPLNGKKVHMLLTAGISHTKYPENARKILANTNCTLGNVEVFAVDKNSNIEPDIVEKHIRELMFGGDEA